MTDQELDILVSEKVLGQVPCPAWRYSNLGSAGGPVSMKWTCSHAEGMCRPVDPKLPWPSYSTNIAAAWQVAERIGRRGGFKLDTTWGMNMIMASFWSGPYANKGLWISVGDVSASRAICLAALALVRTEDGNG